MSDTPSALLKPRLRLFRRSPSPRDRDATPQAGPATARALFHDEEPDEFPTPRVHPKPIEHTPHPLQSVPPAPGETPAARLRALLAREPRSPRATSPPSSDAESDAGRPRFGSSTSSVARDSLRDIFSRALREPGDTPQKGRLRSNSFDSSSMEITPVVDRDRGRRRAARRSLSDEEREKPKPGGRADPSFPLSTALTFDALRARLASSRSQLMEQNPPEALYDHSSMGATSASHSQHQPQASTSPRVNSQVGSLTPHPSFHMSSQLAFQSNQDSEMQRVMGDVLNSENEASTTAPNVAHSTAMPSGSRPSSSLRRSQNDSKLEHRRTSYDLDSSTSSPSVIGANGRQDLSHPHQEGRNHQHEREWNRPRLPSRSGTPEVPHRHSYRRLSHEFRSPSHVKSLSHESSVTQSSAAKPVHRQLERRGSLASLRSFDDDHSSRPSSIGSQADYRDRISELDRERNHEREREWNKRHPPSRPSSSLSTSSNHSFSHSHSHPPRSPSAVPYLTPTHASLQRKSSRTSLRSDSPASLASSRDSLKERDEGEKKEVVHERERNWNSPRPHWSASKTSPASHLRIRSGDNHSLRASLSLPHLRDSNGHGDTSRVPTELQSTTVKVDSSSATSPALLHRSGGRPNPDLETSIGNAGSDDHSPSKTPGAASKFGWNFARSPLPPLELDDTGDRRKSTSSPTPSPRLSGRASEPITSSHIPVRSAIKNFSSIGHATSDMSLTNIVGNESSFQQDYQNKPSGLADSEEPPAGTNSWSREDIAPGSDEASVDNFPPKSTTPKSDPPKPIPEETETDSETEVLTSPSPQDSPQLGALPLIPDEEGHQNSGNPRRPRTPDLPPEEPPVSATPPGTPPSGSPGSQLPVSEESTSFGLVTPPRGSFGTSMLDFRTPSPPHDLPGPPSSSDEDALGYSPLKDHRDDNLNSTLVKTPKPPGAWAATPLPPKVGHRSSSPAAFFPLDSTPPISTSTPLPRANSLPPTHADASTNDSGEDEILTPVGTMSRARSLPLRTPVPPGGWVVTPGQSTLLSNGADQSQYGSLGRRKGLLKVRFDVAESETSATEGHPNSPLSAIRLTNPELPLPKLTMDRGADSDAEVVVNEGASMTTTPIISHRPATPERPSTSVSRENGRSPRSLRKSPSVRVVDAFGRERVDEEGSAGLSINLSNNHADAERKKTSSPPTPRRSSVRIVDAMGKEVDDTMRVLDALESRANRSFEADVSVVSDGSPIAHAEALARMRKALRDLAESLSDADRSEDIDLNSSHLEQLEEVSQAARLARNQLAHNLHLETEKQPDLHHANKSSALDRRLLPATPKKSWNTTIIYFVVIIQLLLVLAMWRYAHAEARRLFYTIYYDPLYPELTPIQESSCFSGTLSTSRPWTILDSYETIRREGWWSISKEIFRAMRHIGDQAWERWGENVQFEKPS